MIQGALLFPCLSDLAKSEFLELINWVHIFGEHLWDDQKEKDSDTNVKSLITELGQNLDIRSGMEF